MISREFDCMAKLYACDLPSSRGLDYRVCPAIGAIDVLIS